MDDTQLLRYSRHILLDDFGIEGQQRLLRARALVVGAGGLGSPALLYLASAGVGHIMVVDSDVVDLSNLQRQIAHTQARVGAAKVDSAQAAIAAINPMVRVETRRGRAEGQWLDRQVAAADVVLDCSDNFATRHAVNAACVRQGRPLVSGAALRWAGQVSVFDPRDAQSPCYACLYPPDTTAEEAQCATFGVFAPLVGIVGAVQAAEALKLMARSGRPLVGRLLMLDARSMEWSEIRVPRAPHCPVCTGHRH